jgi:hypothetical protein
VTKKPRLCGFRRQSCKIEPNFSPVPTHYCAKAVQQFVHRSMAPVESWTRDALPLALGACALRKDKARCAANMGRLRKRRYRNAP